MKLFAAIIGALLFATSHPASARPMGGTCPGWAGEVANAVASARGSTVSAAEKASFCAQAWRLQSNGQYKSTFYRLYDFIGQDSYSQLIDWANPGQNTITLTGGCTLNPDYSLQGDALSCTGNGIGVMNLTGASLDSADMFSYSLGPTSSGTNGIFGTATGTTTQFIAYTSKQAIQAALGLTAAQACGNSNTSGAGLTALDKSAAGTMTAYLNGVAQNCTTGTDSGSLSGQQVTLNYSQNDYGGDNIAFAGIRASEGQTVQTGLSIALGAILQDASALPQSNVPSGPIGTTNSFGPVSCGGNGVPAISPSTLTMEFSGSPPASATDCTWGGWPAQITMGHNGCIGQASWTAGAQCVMEYFSAGCTIWSSCAPRGKQNPVPIDGTPTNTRSGHTMNVGFASVSDSDDDNLTSLSYSTQPACDGTYTNYMAAGSFTASISGLGTVTNVTDASGNPEYAYNAAMTISGLPTGVVEVGMTLTGTGIPALPTGTYIVAENGDASHWFVYVDGNNSISIPSEAIASGIPIYTNADFTGSGAVNVSNVAPYFSMNYGGKINDVPGTGYNAPMMLVVLPGAQACAMAPVVASKIIEDDNEQDDGRADSQFASYHVRLNELLAANGYKENIRCDTLNEPTGNATDTGCDATSLATIMGLSQLNYFIVLDDPNGQPADTTFFAQTAYMNGGTAPAPCGPFYDHVGVRVQLTGWKPTDWQVVHNNVIVAACVTDLEEGPHGGTLGGATCNGTGVYVQFPQKYAYGGGFMKYTC